MTATRPKIFGIGLSKTGTTSLAHALEILGYRTKDYPGLSRYRAGDLSSVDLAVVDAYDALTDTPIPSFYRELDQRYPGAKFILTVRASRRLAEVLPEAIQRKARRQAERGAQPAFPGSLRLHGIRRAALPRGL